MSPEQAASNLSHWAKKCGIEDPPTWLRDRAIDRRVKWGAIVVLSLLFIVGGMMLDQWISPRQSITETARLHQQNTFLSFGPPSAGREVVGGPYLQEEINKMIQAVGKLSDIMHLDIKPTFDTAKSSIENWGQQIQSDGVPDFSKKLVSLAEKLTISSKEIDHILSENARYDREIKLTVHDRDPGPFVRELMFFAADVSVTADLSPLSRETILKSDLSRLRQAINTYDNWVDAAIDNSDYKINSLRSYKVTQ